MSKLIVKHWHGLVSDCHQLLIVPRVPIVPQSASIVSAADVSVKLYVTWSIMACDKLGRLMMIMLNKESWGICLFNPS